MSPATCLLAGGHGNKSSFLKSQCHRSHFSVHKTASPYWVTVPSRLRGKWIKWYQFLPSQMVFLPPCDLVLGSLNPNQFASSFFLLLSFSTLFLSQTSSPLFLFWCFFLFFFLSPYIFCDLPEARGKENRRFFLSSWWCF